MTKALSQTARFTSMRRSLRIRHLMLFVSVFLFDGAATWLAFLVWEVLGFVMLLGGVLATLAAFTSLGLDKRDWAFRGVLVAVLVVYTVLKVLFFVDGLSRFD